MSTGFNIPLCLGECAEDVKASILRNGKDLLGKEVTVPVPNDILLLLIRPSTFFRNIPVVLIVG